MAKRYHHNGAAKTLSEWAKECGVSYGTLYRRIFTLKWPFGKAVTTPHQTYKRWKNE